MISYHRRGLYTAICKLAFSTFRVDEVRVMDPSPPYPYLSGKYKGSYAYHTVKDRMPVILTKVIDFLCQNRKHLEISQGEGSTVLEDVKTVIGKLSKLRSEMQTNKLLLPIPLLDPSSMEYKVWNSYFSGENTADGPKWFDSPWLLVECYMYRAIQAALAESQSLKNLDPFVHLKDEAYNNSRDIIHSLASYTMESSITLNQPDKDLEQHFTRHVEASLWGNRNDLSVSSGNPEALYSQVLEDMHSLKNKILVNNISEVWQFVRGQHEKLGDEVGDLSIIMDNCGLELVADLCLALFCLAHGYFKRVIFYVKTIPWFVSDVTKSDFYTTLKKMKEDGPSELQRLAERCFHHLTSGEFQVVEENYWTLPLPYHVMKKVDPTLFEKLHSHRLLIFKGDLNYRKLGADISWPTTVPFRDFLQGFLPAPLLAVRTIKAEIVSALPPGKAEELKAIDESWMAHGDYGLIQFAQ